MTFSADAPIGAFDSGLGGLTVVREMLRHLPGERIVYIGDTAHVPYGGRPLGEIEKFATELSRFLVEEKGCKALVMACNISSAVALEAVRALYPNIPVLGVIRPGARAAVEMAGGGPVAVLTTAGTARSGAYARAIDAEAPGTPVVTVPCPAFVPLVESGQADTPEAELAARGYLEEALAPPHQARVVVLGCTHYPFLLPALTRVTGQSVAFVDPAGETVRELSCRLTSGGLRAESETAVEHTFYATGDPGQFAANAHTFLGSNVADATQALHWADDRLREG